MIILDDIPTTNKELDFIALMEQENISEMFIDKILTQDNIEDMFRVNRSIRDKSKHILVNDIYWEFGKDYYKPNSEYNEKGLVCYYNVYDMSITNKYEYGKCTYKFILPYNLFIVKEAKKSDYKIYEYTKQIIENIDLFLKKNVSNIISDTTALILSQEPKSLTDGLIPEDMSEDDVMNSYNILRNTHKVKVSDIYFSENDISRLNSFSFKELRDKQKIPNNFTHLKKFLTSKDMEYIVINSVLQPFIDAVKNKDLDFIINNQEFFIKIINELRVFSKKTVKLKYDELVEELILLNEFKTNNFLIRLDFNTFLSNTTRAPILKDYNYEIHMIDKSIKLTNDSLSKEFISNDMFNNASKIVVHSFYDINKVFYETIMSNKDEYEIFYIDQNFLLKNKVYSNKKLYDVFVAILNNYIIIDDKTINKATYDAYLNNICLYEDIELDSNDPYSILIKDKKDT